MEFLDIILIGVALSMDACAITIANCTAHKCALTRTKEWSMPILFAIFQGVMPLIGYLIGSIFATYIASVGKFLTAGIFLLLALKIIFDIFKDKREDECKIEDKKKLTLGVLVLQAVATSIDALAVGVTFVSISMHIVYAVLLIAGVTFLLVSLSLLFGKTLGKLFGSYAEWIGAGILLLLAIKSLVEALL